MLRPQPGLLWLGFALSPGFAVTPAGAAELVVGDVPNPAVEKIISGQDKVFEQVPPVAAAGTLILNGGPVDPQFFPGLFRMTTGGICTASLVGPASILVAAHCVDHMEIVNFVAAGQNVRSICEQATGFRAGNASEDWALCLLETPITGLTYETVDVEAVPAIGTDIILSGYGCTAEGGGTDGQLRLGVSTAAARPAGLPPETSTLYTQSDLAAGEAVLCPGDSGGPAFVFAGNDVSSARSIVGVNSRTAFQSGFSLFAAPGSAAGKAFIESWATRHGQMICGVNLDKNCR